MFGTWLTLALLWGPHPAWWNHTPPPPPAPAPVVVAGGPTLDTSCETYMTNQTNAAREAAGLQPYVVNGTLRYYARQWSYEMASTNGLRHDPNLATHFSWWAIGQNVGGGFPCAAIWAAFMSSPEHRSNILDSQFTEIGVGVYHAHDIDWVTENFREP